MDDARFIARKLTSQFFSVFVIYPGKNYDKGLRISTLNLSKPGSLLELFRFCEYTGRQHVLCLRLTCIICRSVRFHALWRFTSVTLLIFHAEVIMNVLISLRWNERRAHPWQLKCSLQPWIIFTVKSWIVWEYGTMRGMCFGFGSFSCTDCRN